MRPDRRHTLTLVLLVAVLTAACGSAGVTLPSDAAGTELYEQAQGFVEQEKWRQAAEAYDTLLRNYPTSPHLPDARLGLGRAYYEQGRMDSYLRSIDAFRNFLTYHPSHPQVDYAQLMIALGYMGLMRSPDRDQSNTKQALVAFEVFMEDYPNSQYNELAQGNMQEVIDTLAAHELQVASWQVDKGYYEAARSRCHYALRKYSRTDHRCGLLWTIAEAWRREGDRGQARVYYERLVQEHPDCERTAAARRRIQQGGAGGALP